MYVPITPTPAQIKAELDADPLALGYAALEAAQNWNGLISVLNVPRQTIDRRMVAPAEMVEAIAAADFAALAVAARDSILFFMIMAANVPLDPQNTIVRGYFLQFPTGGTRTRLQALQTRQGSRAEFLWGDGVVVSDGLVEAAARLA